MKTVTLLPTSGKLKQKIRSHGSKWTVIAEEKGVGCLAGRTGFLIVPNDGGPRNTTHEQARWVAGSDIMLHA